MSVWLTVEAYSREADEEFIPINAVLRAVGLPELPTPAQPETYWTQEIGGAGCFAYGERQNHKPNRGWCYATELVASTYSDDRSKMVNRRRQ